MEILVQLLDELEDAFWVLALIGLRLGRNCLQFGVLSTASLIVCQTLVIGIEWILLLVGLALACVAGWALSVLSVALGPSRNDTRMA